MLKIYRMDTFFVSIFLFNNDIQLYFIVCLVILICFADAMIYETIIEEKCKIH